MIDEKTLGPLEPIFTFVSHDGTNVNIHPGRLREEVLRKKPEVIMTTVDKDIAYSYVENNCVSLYRVRELATRRTSREPIIYCEDGFTDGIPDVMLVDGHHRYVLAATQGLTVIRSVLLLKEFWKPFQIIGTDKISAAFLKAIPVHKRNY
jgi:hypothetical protein